ncbi:MAG: hypothetical protein A2268_01820 [Candidatus Raymondbacteria bacterium RifOxyA12_full_50_37]|uniref:DUF1016 domain-containing protein n=1 Tax=Candidatus Raymondbacteria bacterium RIFOXYD12_FULL_49_13 TaxID=1817890 RepID=A0A1F7FIU9_UNCRA|nr:MAG: hypothetical protein A2268_01820 [Candidatus Raymondbacteria bacterium RifOxyA12_full_50_37]OGJ90811.1 MAG: hypothetical protein A2248_02325 [Candidatus Raymondbacteria bacterium RIFOXYA2_FULL_49_16]OGJ97378.1 MAG: hypothetical protein A2453_03605 [Candidatus Raymondbacteria bacterium RIFOXYC2_FULL_50_21]OGK06483.1 MAG: hypothetical protein A2487_21410 [Candidatus Raymondbacteria bacterium RifOxyC12_full_50_8]OGK06538.1 MAG: hypothetical protein A2519_04410 [Candidatus Raymondbacteria b
MQKNIIDTQEYRQFIAALKDRVTASRISAAKAINRDIIFLYWDIGKGIVEKQEKLKWGNAVVEMVARDLRESFPQTHGFSSQNVWRMRQFYLEHTAPEFLKIATMELKSSRITPTKTILSQAVRELDPSGAKKEILSQAVREFLTRVPWGHHANHLSRIKDPVERFYYIRATAQFGWSRNVLLNQIKAGAYERAVADKKTHNFPAVLPEYLAEQADEALKSSYNLEFLGIQREVKERVLEDHLIDQIQRFILELGYGFCFIGRQYRMVLEDKEYFIDLLFYHRFLKSLVAIELKVGPFEPEYAGKMDFYLNLLNEKERGPGDNPAIGIILCAKKNDVEVEFSLKTKGNPIGVASYSLQNSLPEKFKGKLPSPKQFSEVVRAALPSK